MPDPLRREPDVRDAEELVAGGEAALHSVDDQPDAASAHAQFDKLLDLVADQPPAVHEHLDAARADLLAATSFPKELCRQVWSNNPNERLNKEIRRAYRRKGGGVDRLNIRPTPGPSEFMQRR